MDATKTWPTGRAREYRVMQRAEIEGLIADGKNVIIVDQHVLKVDAWMRYHPGGDKAIQHMVGRDATDEVTACVPFRPSWSLCPLRFCSSSIGTDSLQASILQNHEP